MAADLHIHAMVNTTEADLSCFFANHLGSRWQNPNNPCNWTTGGCSHWRSVMNTPAVWIGEVSWLKAALLGTDEQIPEPVQAVQDLVGEDLPVLDEELKDKIITAVSTPNTRNNPYTIANPEEVSEWVDEHMGLRLFTVSW